MNVARQTTTRRRDCEDGNSSQKHAASSKEIACRATGQDQCCQEQRIGFHYPLHVNDACPKARLKGRERDIHHSAVDERDTRAKNCRGENPWLSSFQADAGRWRRLNGGFVAWSLHKYLAAGIIPLVAEGCQGVVFATATEAHSKRRMARGGKLNANIDSVRLVTHEKEPLPAIKEVKEVDPPES